jgi:hypothetical protein
MRTAILSASLLFLTSASVRAGESTAIELKLVGPVALSAPSKTEAVSLKAEKAEEARRCAFLGMFGSFHLIGSKGTAAYMLGNDKYIADLRAAGEEKNWWLYRPTGNGDPWTTMWAFARNRGCDGKYSVLRKVNGVWCQYEQTEAWGDELDRPGQVPVRAFSDEGGPSNAELLEKLRGMDDKLDAILRRP